MAEEPTYGELKKRITLLESELAQQKRFEGINATLFKISTAVNMTSNLEELFQTIHLSLGTILDTTNFYIALYDKTKDRVTFPYCVDTVDECYPPVIEVSKTASLTAEVIRTGRPVFVTKAEILSRRANSSFKIPACTPSEIWLGVPLKTRNEIIGVMTVQSYNDPMCYDQTDLNLMVSVADHVALSVERKRVEEEIKTKNEKLAAANEELIAISKELRTKERALISEKNFTEALFESIPGYLYVYDDQGNLVRWNKKHEEMTGYSSEELSHMTLSDWFEGEDALRVTAAIEKGFTTGYGDVEAHLLIKGGKKLHVHANGVRLDIDGKTYLTGVGIDITARKRAEEALQRAHDELELRVEERTQALQESEVRLRTLVQTIPDLVWLKDPDGVFLDCNTKFERLYGAAKKDIIGKTDYDFVNRELADFFREHDRKAAAAGVPISNEEWLTFADGGHRALFDTIKTPILGAEGNLLGVLGIARDISERKCAEEKLKRSEEIFRKAFDNSPDPMNINRIEDGKYTSINPAFTKIMGYTEDEIRVKTSIEYDIWENIADRQRLVDGLKKNGVVTNLEATFRTKGGEIVHGLMSTSVIDLEGVPHIISITRDITERKKAERALRESEDRYRMVANFTYDWVLRPKLFDRSNPGLNGFQDTEKVLPTTNKVAGNGSDQMDLNSSIDFMDLMPAR